MLLQKKRLLCLVCIMFFAFPLLSYGGTSLPLVKVLSTGGTIAGKYNPAKA